MAATLHSLQTAAAHHEYLRDQLRVQFPDIDDQTLADTLEGISDLDQAIIALMRSADDDDMLCDGIDARIKELLERKGRLAERVTAKRDIVCRTMERAELPKIEAPDFTISLRRTPTKVVIVEEAQIPNEYMREKVEVSPDRSKIRDALEANKPVPGAALSNGGYGLTIRRK